MRVALSVLLALLAVTPAASGRVVAAAAGPMPRATAVIDTGTRRVRVAVEVAETPEHRTLGLMHRRSLPRNAGMVFLFPRSTRGAFWMKNTLIPLSIAFFDGRGRILRLLDMAPCKSDPCRSYDPGVAFRGALEVNRGAFKRWGVARGDVVRLVRQTRRAR